jgi:hypothetical protein
MQVYVNAHCFQSMVMLWVQEGDGSFISMLVYINVCLYQLSKYQCTFYTFIPTFIVTFMNVTMSYTSETIGKAEARRQSEVIAQARHTNNIL